MKHSTDFCDKCGQTLPNYGKPLTFGDWVIDYPKRVFYKGKDVLLSEQQFNLFEKLVRNQVVHNRKTTYEELWAYLYPEGEVEPNTVKVMLHQIRIKMPIHCIETIWGVGLIFHPNGCAPPKQGRPRTRVPRNIDRINVRGPEDGK